MLKRKKQNYVNVVFFSLLAPFLLHHNLTSYYLTFRYRVQALYNSSKQGNVTAALYISCFLIKLTPNFSWEAECFLQLPLCMYANGPSRTASLHERAWAGHCNGHFQAFACIQSNVATFEQHSWRQPYLLIRKYVKELWRICTSSRDPQKLLKNIMVSDLSYKLFTMVTNLKRQTEKLLESVPKAVN